MQSSSLAPNLVTAGVADKSRANPLESIFGLSPRLICQVRFGAATFYCRRAGHRPLRRGLRVEMRVFVDGGRPDDKSAAAACEGGFCFFRSGQTTDIASLTMQPFRENRHGGYRYAL